MTDYGNEDDWSWGYGFDIKDGKYTICMAGGGSHWENYVIKKDGVYVENTDGMRKIDGILVSCPDGDYVAEKPRDYELKEGETDFYEMIQECYEEEIMEYEEEEYYSSSDEEESDVEEGIPPC